MPGTKRVINIGTNADDGTGDLLRDAFNKVNQNFDDVWTYGAVNSNLNLTGDTINGTTDVIINPADTGAFKVTGDTIINSGNGNYNFTVHGDLASNVLYVDAATGRVGILNTSPTVAFDVTGDAKVSGTTTLNNLTVEGATILGNANTDTIQYVGKINSDLLSTDSLKHIGATTSRWGTVYATNLDVSGSISGTFTGSMTSTMTGDVNNTNITTVNLTATGPSNLQNVNISGNLVVQGTTTTLETNDVLVNNQITFEGTTADDHETILTVTEPTQDNTITFKNASGTVAFTNDVPTSINDLSDVDTSTSAPSNGQALVWNNSNLEWEPGTVGGTTTFVGLTDTPANFTGSAGKVVKVNAGETALEFVTSSGGLGNIVEDTTPQLGGTLDANGNTIDMGTNVLTDTNLGEFITAHTWGNHASAGYITASSTDTLTNKTLTSPEIDTITRTGLFKVEASTYIVLDADGGEVFFRDGSAGNFGSLLRNGANDLTIASGGSQAVIFTDANAAFQGDVSVSGTLTGYQTTAGLNGAIDTHLNQSNPTSGYVLSWNGTDYAWVANSGTGLANIVDDTTPQLGGNLDGQAFNITTTGKILYANMYATEGDLPNATTYHGMFAHVHATGKGYFAHGGNWIKLVDETSSTTDDLTEGSTNLYYTDARADTRATLRINAASITTLNDVDTVTAGDDGKILYYDHSSTSFKWKTDATGGATSINTAGNTGTGSVTFASETLQVTGQSGQIDVDAAAFALSLSLDSNLTGLTTINTHTIPSGTGTFALEGNAPVHSFNVGNNGSTDYTFSDTANHWFPTTENDPVLYLRRGDTYNFVVSAGGSHPFEIRVSNGGSAYNTGVTNNGTGSGTITFKVPMSAPATLYYQCQNHSGMGNTINIV